MKKKHEQSKGRPRSDFPYPIFSKGSHIEIDGFDQLLVEGCEGIIKYDEDSVKLGLGSRALLICGAKLCIWNMFGKTVCVRGQIRSVEFL